MNRKELKLKAKHSLKKHYWLNVLVALITAITLTSALNSSLFRLVGASESNFNSWDFIKNIISYFSPGFLADTTNPIVVFIDSILSSSINIIFHTVSFPLYVASTIFSGISDSSLNIFLIILAIIIYLLVIIFLSSPLHVGSRKYFLDHFKNDDTNIKDIGFAFQKYYLNIVYTKMLRFFYETLWSLTIFGGPIAYYRMRMVNYILAENPSLSPVEVLKLSRRMMHGHKWELFVFDISFIFYDILSTFTANLLDYFFLNPYKYSAEACVYFKLKELIIEEDFSIAKSLVVENENNKFGLIKRANLDYDINYQLIDYILIFFSVSIIGWLWEVGLHLVQTFEFANRGTLWGPWLPIYGVGCVAVLFFLQKFRKYPWLTFLTSMILCLTIEYITGFVLYKTTGRMYWDYSNMPFNLNGYICLYGGLIFGLGCTMAVYFLAPFLYQLFHHLSNKTLTIISIVLIVLFLSDGFVSLFFISNTAGVDSYIRFIQELYLKSTI